MKISKILFISFFSLIGIALLSVPFIAKNKIEVHLGIKETSQIIEQELPAFNHLRIENYSCYELIDQETGVNQITYTLPKDSTLEKIKYQLVGDTLILLQGTINETQKAKIKCGYLTSISSRVNLNIKLNQESLNITCEKHRITIDNKKVKELTIKASNKGYIRSSHPLLLNHLNIDLNSASIELYNCKVKEISGKLSEKSKLRINRAEKITIEKDFSSQIREKS